MSEACPTSPGKLVPCPTLQDWSPVHIVDGKAAGCRDKWKMRPSESSVCPSNTIFAQLFKRCHLYPREFFKLGFW